MRINLIYSRSIIAQKLLENNELDVKIRENVFYNVEPFNDIEVIKVFQTADILVDINFIKVFQEHLFNEAEVVQVVFLGIKDEDVKVNERKVIDVVYLT